jgi:hypothetical protein
MTFLDKKEEVIDLIMTRQGRELYASASFAPAYYAFFDNDIIYDNAHSNNTEAFIEEQNKIVPRIKERIHITKGQNEWVQATADSERKNIPPYMNMLGASSPFTQYKPAWVVNMNEGKLLTGSVEYTPREHKFTADYDFEKIPQLTLKSDYRVWHMEGEYAALFKKSVYDIEDNVLILEKESDGFFLEIEEKNAEETNDNFVLEVFKYVYNDVGAVIDLEPLNFLSEETGKNNVEFYFDISTDENAEDKVKIRYIDEPIKPLEEEDECE